MQTGVISMLAKVAGGVEKEELEERKKVEGGVEKKL